MALPGALCEDDDIECARCSDGATCPEAAPLTRPGSLGSLGWVATDSEIER